MCWDCNDNPKGDPYKNYIRGGVEIDDFEKEVNYQTRLKGRSGYRRKFKKEKTRPGCPENNFGPHIYVWTSEFISDDRDFFFRVFGWHKWEEKVCAGCEKTGRPSRLTERYAKVKERKYTKMYGDGTNVPRGAAVSRYGRRNNRKANFTYWCWEDYDEKFIAAKEEYLKRHNNSFDARLMTSTTFFRYW